MNAGPRLVSSIREHARRSLMPTPARKRGFGLCRPCLLAFAVVLAALLFALAVPRAHADIDDVLGTENHWDGTVDVSTTTLTITEGSSATYSIRLSEEPIYYKHVVNDMNVRVEEKVPCTEGSRDHCSWFVFVYINGKRPKVGYVDVDGDGDNDVLITPSIGRDFVQDLDLNEDESDGAEVSGDWEVWKTVRVTALEDSDGQDQTLTFNHEVWGDDAECPVHQVGTVSVQLTDNEGSTLPPQSNLSISDTPVVEGGTADFLVTLNPGSSETVTVDYTTVMGSAAPGSDYTGKSGTLSFTSGTTEQTIQVSTTDDSVYEASENFTVKLSGASGARITDDVGIGTINDNDSQPTLSIMDASVEEGRTARFRVTLNGETEQPVTASYGTQSAQGDTATAGTDYHTKSGTLSFSVGTTEQTIEVATREDSVDEPDETFTVTLSNPSGATLADDTASGTITEDDLPPTLTVMDTTAQEGETASFTVTLSGESAQTVTVIYSTTNQTATAGSDYDTASDTVTFDAGTTEQTIEVETLEDSVDEPNETFTVTLRSPSNATLFDDEGIGTITDDDPRPTLSISDETVTEGEQARFTVTLTGQTAQPVTVSYRTEDDSATEGTNDDYATQSGTLIFNVGTTRQFINVPTHDDSDDESSESFKVILSSPNWATLRKGTGFGTIIDNDETDPSLPTLSITDVTVEEGDTATFTVTLSPAGMQTVTVSYDTRNDSATAGANNDYTARSGSLSFSVGTMQQTIDVPTRDDNVDESGESFRVILSSPNGAALSKGTGFGTIIDNDDNGGGNHGNNGGSENWEPMKRRMAWLNRTLLPEIGRALAFDAVRCRVEQPFTSPLGGGAQPAISPSLPVSPAATSRSRPSQLLALNDEERNGAEGESLTLQQVLDGSSFLLPLIEEDAASARLATWGCGEIRSLDGGGENGTAAWGGEVYNAQLGADIRLSRDMIAGVSVSQSGGSLDYGGAAGTAERGGSYDLRLTGIHPYVGWSLSPGLEMWTTVGVAKGKLRVSDRDHPAGLSMESSATLTTGAVGINGRIQADDVTTVRLKGEGALARLKVGSADKAFSEATANLQRLRLAVETSYKSIIENVGLLTPWGELGLRHDGGDGETGASLEAGGGLRFRNIEQGWNAEVSGRWLALREDARPRERGFAARFRYDPETLGFGPWVGLSQSWGDTGSRVNRLWEEGASEPAALGSMTRRLDLELGYGFAALEGRGALTPFMAMSLDEHNGRGYRLGSRLALRQAASVSVEAERRERPADATDHTVMVRSDARF